MTGATKQPTTKVEPLLDASDVRTLARLVMGSLVVLSGAAVLGMAVRVFVWAAGLGG